MRAFGRQISKWWLVPVLIVCSPVLLTFFLLGNNLAGAIFGPPAIWDVPYHHPSQDDLAGKYVEKERHWDRAKTGPDALFELKRDGTMTVRDLPADFGMSQCVLSGFGTWRTSGGQDIGLDFTSDGAPGICESGWYASALEVAGHSKPYRLYWVLGDPDSGTGIWFKRQ
jgi:hypothetical protein